MHSSTLVVLKESEDDSLLTLYEARLGLNMFTTGTDGLNDQIEMLIEWSSDEIAFSCNRSFGRETVQETIREIMLGGSSSSSKRLYLAKFPNIEIESVFENGNKLSEGIDFEVEDQGGWLVRLNNKDWVSPVVVIYTGGYNLPKEAPGSLKQAAILLTRESYYAAARGDASVKLVVHKESRVGFFDPRAPAGGGGGRGSSPARRAIDNLLQGYTRDLGVM